MRVEADEEQLDDPLAVRPTLGREVADPHAPTFERRPQQALQEVRADPGRVIVLSDTPSCSASARRLLRPSDSTTAEGSKSPSVRARVLRRGRAADVADYGGPAAERSG